MISMKSKFIIRKATEQTYKTLHRTKTLSNTNFTKIQSRSQLPQESDSTYVYYSKHTVGILFDDNTLGMLEKTGPGCGFDYQNIYVVNCHTSREGVRKTFETMTSITSFKNCWFNSFLERFNPPSRKLLYKMQALENRINYNTQFKSRRFWNIPTQKFQLLEVIKRCNFLEGIYHIRLFFHSLDFKKT